jgi:hypothetical protein
MNIVFHVLVGLCLFIFSVSAKAQSFSALRIDFPAPLIANVSGSAMVTAQGVCRYPYPQSQQPPDFVLTGNTLSMTVYLRDFGQNIVPVPPCVNRIQTYALPALPAGSYQMDVAVRFFQDIGSGSFGSRLGQGSFMFEVASAVPITQVDAINGWGLALLMLGLIGVARWVSGVSPR